jgi:L-amino acid N-acyltransferase YncA
MEYPREWFAERGNALHFVLVAEHDGKVRGHAATGRYRSRAGYDSTVETSVYVAPRSLGRGLGRELYRALLEAVDAGEAHRAVAGVALPNPASERLHLELGFRRVAHSSEARFQARAVLGRRLVRAPGSVASGEERSLSAGVRPRVFETDLRPTWGRDLSQIRRGPQKET